MGRPWGFMRTRETILLVEDDSDDVLQLGLALKEAGILNPLAVVSDGLEALDYLKGEGNYSDRSKCPFPSLILLDLHMPRMNGFEVLKWLRQEPTLRHLPVVVLTASAMLTEVKTAYELGANSCLIKSTNPIQLNQAIKDMAIFWLQTCLLPDAASLPAIQPPAQPPQPPPPSAPPR